MTVFRRAAASTEPGSRGDDLGPVLVAVDGHPRSRPAVEWAAAEAAARGSSLHIVHVLSPALPPDAFGIALLTSGPAEAAGALVLDEAERRARSVAPDIHISRDLRPGTAPATVRAGLSGAALIVVARGRRAGRFTAAPAGQLARRSRTPVAVAQLVDHPAPGPSAGRVVVGLGPSGHPAALAFAVRAAHQRGVGLTVLEFDPADLELPAGDVRRRPATRRRGAALVAESAGAALVVVGAPARRLFPPAQSIGRAALGAVRSPVVIVPAEG